ncbi:hypothetical protein STENM327S_06843 [Streptomyces tendae]
MGVELVRRLRRHVTYQRTVAQAPIANRLASAREDFDSSAPKSSSKASSVSSGPERIGATGARLCSCRHPGDTTVLDHYGEATELRLLLAATRSAVSPPARPLRRSWPPPPRHCSALRRDAGDSRSTSAAPEHARRRHDRPGIECRPAASEAVPFAGDYGVEPGVLAAFLEPLGGQGCTSGPVAPNRDLVTRPAWRSSSVAERGLQSARVPCGRRWTTRRAHGVRFFDAGAVFTDHTAPSVPSCSAEVLSVVTQRHLPHVVKDCLVALRREPLIGCPRRKVHRRQPVDSRKRRSACRARCRRGQPDIIWRSIHATGRSHLVDVS